MQKTIKIKEHTHLGRAIDSVIEKQLRLDQVIKEILADEQVFACILKHTTTEFRNFSIAEIIPCIGERDVSRPLLPGLTNASTFRSNVESHILNEGVIYYDVRAVAYVPGTKEAVGIKILIDIEAQRDTNPGYEIPTRGLFYAGRMLSEQLGTEFSPSHGKMYDDLKKVYSIWVCTDCPQYCANTTTVYKICQKSFPEEYEDDSRSDLLRVIIVRLPKDNERSKANYKPGWLHAMLSDLLDESIDSAKKRGIMKERYGLRFEQETERRLDEMCNLSEGIWEKGMEKGMEKGLTQEKIETIRRLLTGGASRDTMSMATGLPVEEIERIIKTFL